MIYIILFIVLIFFGNAYINAKTRFERSNDIQDEKKRNTVVMRFDENAKNNTITTPSWISDETSVRVFIEKIVKDADAVGVPLEFCSSLLKNVAYKNKLINIAGIMEESNYSFEEQITGTSEVFLNDWNITPYSEKQAIISKY